MEKEIMKYLFSISVALSLFVEVGYSQQIQPDKVISIDNLKKALKSDVKKTIEASGPINQAALAEYFRIKFSERFYYDWKSVDQRLIEYDMLYQKQANHESRAQDHMLKFADSTQWKLPFNYLNGDPVNAYALRHLARSHKMVDIAFQYFYDDKNPKYIYYFNRQVRSLNTALEAGAFEKIEDGNGVYEVFRAGYRVLNWLRVHNMFLGEAAYSDQDQLTLIATMLQHGQHLYENNDSFRAGNHQTKGMSALAMLAILFRDFEGTDKWYSRALERLEEHMNAEINKDGFQFERSVHYHINDIDNYFYFYQLAKISNYQLSKSWKNGLQSLFTTLTKIAYPNKTAPVLQDDTKQPWAEVNEIGTALTLGYILFGNPEYGYFANPKVADNMYWFLQGKQIAMLDHIEKTEPSFKSLGFEDTGYFIMRDGWQKKGKMMIISAGLDPEKPDHQHGDMLGVQMMTNTFTVLPNYQVRYSLPDYDFFKNSMVKNVALVDEELQGKEYKGNKGGSGFGKFLNLPNPTVISWQTGENEDIFIGLHDGFENIGVNYSRQIIFVDHDFWIVKDNFTSAENHLYKQVWQGHYSLGANNEQITSSFSDGSGLDIFQLNIPDEIDQDRKRGKGWSVFVKKNQNNFSFVTILHPFKSFDQSLDLNANKLQINGWSLTDSNIIAEGKKLCKLSKDNRSYLFGVEKIRFKGNELAFDFPIDLIGSIGDYQLTLKVIGVDEVRVEINGQVKSYLNNITIKKEALVKAGDILKIGNK